MSIDALLAGIAVIFGLACLFYKEGVWSIITTLVPSEKNENGAIPDEWKTNMNMLGGVSFVLGAMLMLAL